MCHFGGVNARRGRAPLSQIAKAVGFSRRAVYYAAEGKVSPRLQWRVSLLIRNLEAGAFHFERHRQQWKLVDGKACQPVPHRRPLLPEKPAGPLILALQQVIIALRGSHLSTQQIAAQTGLHEALVQRARAGFMSWNTQVRLSTILAAE